MRRTKEQAKKTRQDVLRAAAEVFYEKGVSATTLDQIASRCGVTRGAIYWHFKDKGELFGALLSEIKLPQEEFLNESLEAGAAGDPLALLEAASSQVLAMLEEDEHQQRIFAIITLGCEVRGEMSDLVSRLDIANQDLYGQLLARMERAACEGILSDGWTGETAARAFQCTVNGLFGEWLRSGRAFSLQDVGKRVVRALIADFGKRNEG